MTDAILCACVVCGNSFKPHKSKANKFCGAPCYHAAQRSGIVKVGRDPKHLYPCHECGVETNRIPSKCRDGSTSEKVFCSRACYDKNRADRRGGCKACGERVPFKSSKYCSWACRISDKKPDPCTCKNCGCVFTAVKFVARPSGKVELVAYGGAKTCSYECHNLWMRTDPERKRKIGLAFAGPLHPNWQGGKSLLNNVSNRGPNWKKQRAAAIKRDGACVDCGMTDEQCRQRYGRSLDVDHVTPFHNFTDYRKANRLINLQCRCASCHRIAEAKRDGAQMVLGFQDSAKRKHKGYAVGERHPRAKLTANDVLAIRRRVAEGESQNSLRLVYGVSQAAINSIVLRKTWQNV